MREIILQIEQVNRENFDHFINLLTNNRESEKKQSFNISMINRLKEDAFSINPKFEAYLGKIGLEWVTYVIIMMSYSTRMALPTLFIDEIFVLDNYRNLGVGASMLELCLRKAKKRGCGKIDMVVPARNKKAKHFFEFNGAVAVDIDHYEVDPYTIRIGKSSQKMTYTDFIRKKSISKLTRLNSAK